MYACVHMLVHNVFCFCVVYVCREIRTLCDSVLTLGVAIHTIFIIIVT